MSSSERSSSLSVARLSFLSLSLLNFSFAATVIRISEQIVPVTVNGQTRSVYVPFWVLPSGVTAPPPASSLEPVVVSILSEALATFPSTISYTSAFIPPVPVAGSTYNVPSPPTITGITLLPTGNAISVLESALSTFMVPGATAVTVVLPVPVTDASATRMTTEVIHLPPALQTSEPPRRPSTTRPEISIGSSETIVGKSTRTIPSSSQRPLASSTRRSTKPSTTTERASTKLVGSRPSTFSNTLSLRASQSSSMNLETSSAASSENTASRSATITTMSTTTGSRAQTSVPPAPNANGGTTLGITYPIFLAAIIAEIGARLVQ